MFYRQEIKIKAFLQKFSNTWQDLSVFGINLFGFAFDTLNEYFPHNFDICNNDFFYSSSQQCLGHPEAISSQKGSQHSAKEGQEGSALESALAKRSKVIVISISEENKTILVFIRH